MCGGGCDRLLSYLHYEAMELQREGYPEHMASCVEGFEYRQEWCNGWVMTMHNVRELGILLADAYTIKSQSGVRMGDRMNPVSHMLDDSQLMTHIGDTRQAAASTLLNYATSIGETPDECHEGESAPSPARSQRLE